MRYVYLGNFKTTAYIIPQIHTKKQKMGFYILPRFDCKDRVFVFKLVSCDITEAFFPME